MYAFQGDAKEIFSLDGFFWRRCDEWVHMQPGAAVDPLGDHTGRPGRLNQRLWVFGSTKSVNSGPSKVISCLAHASTPGLAFGPSLLSCHGPPLARRKTFVNDFDGIIPPREKEHRVLEGALQDSEAVKGMWFTTWDSKPNCCRMCEICSFFLSARFPSWCLFAQCDFQ